MALTNHFLAHLMKADFNLESATVKVALGGSGTDYTFDKTSHNHLSDIFDGGTTGEELDYTSPDDRIEVTGKYVTEDDLNDRAEWGCDDVVFPSLSTTQDIQFIVFYQQKGGDDSTPADDEIIALYDDDSAGSLAGLPLPTNGSDVIIETSDNGVVHLKNT